MNIKKIIAAFMSLALIIGLLPDYSIKFKDNSITAEALPAYNDSIVYKIVDDYVVVYAANKSITSADIPSYIERLPVKQIASSGFASCSKLSYIKLPDTLEEIGVKAFYQCDALTSIELPSSIKKLVQVHSMTVHILKASHLMKV